MTEEVQLKEYALKHYPQRFARSTFSVDSRGKKTWKRFTVEPIVTIGEVCYFIQAHKDESPLILSKKVLND